MELKRLKWISFIFLTLSGCGAWHQQPGAVNFPEARMECRMLTSEYVKRKYGPYRDIPVQDWNSFMEDCMGTKGYTWGR